jgi:hypothetical protein
MAFNAVSAIAFRSIDADASGGVSLKELKQGQALASSALRSAIGAKGADTVFKSFDANSDGKLSANEFADGLATLAPSTASALLAAQEQQNPVSQLLTGLKSGLYASLPGVQGQLATTAASVLAAYSAKM